LADSGSSHRSGDEASFSSSATFSPAAATSKAISQVRDPAPEFAYAFVNLVEFYFRHIARARRPDAKCTINGESKQADTKLDDTAICVLFSLRFRIKTIVATYTRRFNVIRSVFHYSTPGHHSRVVPEVNAGPDFVKRKIKMVVVHITAFARTHPAVPAEKY
jgi:hypothetical protein